MFDLVGDKRHIMSFVGNRTQSTQIYFVNFPGMLSVAFPSAFWVGVPGFEPGLHEPESCVLPLYDTPTKKADPKSCACYHRLSPRQTITPARNLFYIKSVFYGFILFLNFLLQFVFARLRKFNQIFFSNLIQFLHSFKQIFFCIKVWIINNFL